MHQSIKIIIVTFLSLQLYASDKKPAPAPPLIFTKAEALNENVSRIPFKVIDQLIVVEAELLNKKGNFIIDTGSETLILNSVHFKTTYKHFKRPKTKSGVNNSIDGVEEKTLDELRLQSLRLDKMNADVINLSHIEKTKKMNLLGIIGYSILKDFEVFIDMHLNQITLSRTDKKGNKLSKNVYAETIADSIDFKLKKHTIILQGYVGGRKLKFGLDTAAEFNQLNKDVDPKILKYFYPTRQLKLSGASGKKIKVLAGKLYRVSLNDSIYFGPMKTVVTNLKQMNEAFGTHLDGVLGFEFFLQKRTIINYKKRKLYFIKNPIITN